MASDLAFQIMRMRSAPDNYLDAPKGGVPAELQVRGKDKLKPIARITEKSSPRDSYTVDDGRMAKFHKITSSRFST